MSRANARPVQTFILAEARRLLPSGQTVAGAAFAVGYQSPSQFSREYGRRFGLSPAPRVREA